MSANPQATDPEEDEALAQEDLAALAETGLLPYVEGATDGVLDAEENDWWERYQAKREARAGALWGGDTVATGPAKKGAAAIKGFISGGNYAYDYAYQGRGYTDDKLLALRLVQTLRFATDLARLAAANGALPVAYAGPGSGYGALALNPTPVREIGGDLVPDHDEANNIVGGEALHEGGHRRHTPANMAQRYGNNCNLFTNIDYETAVRVGFLVEDSYVESKVLDEYPGFQDYLDAAWNYETPTTEVLKVLTRVSRKANQFRKEDILTLAQDLNRRYEPYTDPERALFEKAPVPRQRLLQHAARVLQRARLEDDPDRRAGLALELMRLIETGEVPKDQNEEGEDKLDAGQVGDLNKASEKVLQRGGKGHNGDGENAQAKEDALSEGEHRAVDDEIAAEREEDANPWPDLAEGAEIPRTVWTTPEINYYTDGKYRAAQRAGERHVRDLVKALHFRAVTATRFLAGKQRGSLNQTALALAKSRRHPRGTDRVFRERDILAAPRAHVEVLVDKSGSTGGLREENFRIATHMIHEGLTELNRQQRGGVTHNIRAHTSGWEPHPTSGHNEYVCAIHRVIDPDHQDPARIGTIFAQGGNFDGEALWSVLRWYDKHGDPTRQRVLFNLSDGLPNGLNYGQVEAYAHVNWVVDRYRRKGWTILTLYIGELGQGSRPGARLRGNLEADSIRTALDHMYGPEGTGWLHIPEPADLPRVIGKVLNKLLAWRA